MALLGSMPALRSGLIELLRYYHIAKYMSIAPQSTGFEPYFMEKIFKKR
jgi:hypothetical protein